MSFDWFSFNVRLNVPSMHNYAQDASVNDYAFEAWERMTYGGLYVKFVPKGSMGLWGPCLVAYHNNQSIENNFAAR